MLPVRSQPCQRGGYSSCSHLGISSSNGPATAALRRQQMQQQWQQAQRTSASASSSSPGSDPNPPVRGVIFDVDGVLCSSEHLSRESAAAVMKQLHGLDVAPEEFIPFGGQGEARFLGGVAEKYNVQNYDSAAAIDKFFDIYINTYTKGPAASRIAFPGAVELVRACRAAGLATAVASSAERVKVDANLSAAGFTDEDFGCVVSGASFARNKPAPDCFLAAAEGLGLPPSACVVIEDAPAGIQAARAAGMRVLGVTTTLSDEEMAAEAPDGVFSDVGRMRVEDIKGVQYTQAAAASVRQ